MNIELCEFESCQKPFNVFEHKLAMPGTREKEPVTCPHCSHTIQKSTNGWWTTSILSERQQKEFYAGKK